MTRRTAIWLVAILLIASALAWTAHWQWSQRNAIAKQHFIEEQSGLAHQKSEKIQDAFRSIYENLRTLASLPSVRSVDRHGTNLSQEAKVTFQHIYNNLATNVAVSEVYVIPIDLDAEKIDPVTREPEAPIIMFDHLILNAGLKVSRDERLANPDSIAHSDMQGPAEVEIYEYRQFMQHAAWFRAHYPDSLHMRGLNFPVITGGECITCDNTDYIKTGLDADRSGMLMSVPFFGNDGKIKGMVSAIILSNALRKLLPGPDYALVNPQNSYTLMRNAKGKLHPSITYVDQAKPDPNLYYSEVIPLTTKDTRSPWFIWASTPNSMLLNDKEVTANNLAFGHNLAAICVLALTIGTILMLLDRHLAQAKKLNESLAEAHALSVRAEEETRKSADELQHLNAQVTNLNVELSQKISELRRAQDDIVRKGRMAQLGNLVATVAHEIRNPLGAVRTSAFRLKRQLANNTETERSLTLIENGISRCDNIIAQLLDFSRNSELQSRSLNLDSWLEKVVVDQVPEFSALLSVRCDFDSGADNAFFDPDRLQRSVVNIMSNAAEALLDPRTQKPVVEGSQPEISISTRRTDRGFEITIADNGPGIEQSLHQKIRDPLFTTKSFGTGLGIPAAEKVVEMHGGKLEIESESGQGAVFRLVIPQTAALAMAAE